MVDITEFEDERLYILKRPSVKSWTILLSFIFLGITIAVYLADSIITQSLCALVCLMIGLTCLEEWEDCILDQYENKIIQTRSKWYTRLLGREKTTRKFELSSVRGIEMTNKGILMVLKSGILIPIIESPLNKRDMKIISAYITSILRLNYIEEVSADPYVDYDEWFDFDNSDTSQENEGIVEDVVRRSRVRDEIKIISNSGHVY